MSQMIEAAKRYAASDKSDPFAYRRALTHLRTGVASFSNGQGKQAYYDAELHYEPREIQMPDGSKLQWQAEVYKNIYRP